MADAEAIKVLGFFCLSAVKFFIAPAATLAAGFSLFETIVITSSGGICGITLFYFAGFWVNKKVEKYRPKVVATGGRAATRKIFSRRNRFIIRFKRAFGFWGLVWLTPSLLSIPIGAVLAAKFFRGNKFMYPMLLLSCICWSIVLSVCSHSLFSLLDY